jgi:hypothetical protein
MSRCHLGWQFALEPVISDVSAAVSIERSSASHSLFCNEANPDLTWMRGESLNQVDPFH